MKAEFNFEWYEIKIKNERAQRKIDIKGFADKNKQMEYYEEVRNNLNRIACQKRGQEKWNEICKVCTEAGERVLGRARGKSLIFFRTPPLKSQKNHIQKSQNRNKITSRKH